MANRRLVALQCEDCGEVVIRRWQNARARVCFTCGLRRHLDQVRDMHAHSGPYYERWLAATGRGSTTETKDGGAS